MEDKSAITVRPKESLKKIFWMLSRTKRMKHNPKPMMRIRNAKAIFVRARDTPLFFSLQVGLAVWCLVACISFASVYFSYT